MERAVRERDEALGNERAKFGKLSDDFIFNLHLIEERDRELDSYETAFAGFSFYFSSNDFVFHFSITCNFFKRLEQDRCNLKRN